ncbi:MAG TPA: hypothetical protein VFY84_15680 [Jiangellales bacterium]|nr:hypothetical protein [Jiangellales bacterium]
MGGVLYEYFVEPSWTMKVTPLKTVVQNCVSGQILEVVRFEAPAFGHLTFVHATCWVRDHGEWKLVLQTEGGPLETRNAAAS